MIPQVQDDIKQDFTIETLPSRTFRMNHNNLTIIGTIDEIQAVEQAVFLILNTERYEWLIHSWDYGVELHNLIGKDVNIVFPKLNAGFVKPCFRMIGSRRFRTLNLR